MPEPIAGGYEGPEYVKYMNSEGEMGVLSGRVDPSAFPLQQINVPGSWVQRMHPLRNLWVKDELRQRASFLGTQRHLAPFLVPHRFEGKDKPSELSRAKLAYSIGLNSSYLQEVFGHLRAAPAHYNWGKLGDPGADKDATAPPSSGVAKIFWSDATGTGKGWTNFFEGTILEWMLTSPGGFLLVDSNKPPNSFINRLLASRTGIRSSFKFIPFSWVEDFGLGPRGFRWVKIGETYDNRQPRMEGNETGYQKRHVIYSIEDDGRTKIERFDDKGKQIGPTVYQTVATRDKHPRLPLIPVTLGEHPDLNVLGAGLLMGLDDIVIDLYNVLTEVREAYRSSVFTFLSYRGEDMSGVQTQLESGTRLVHVGDSQHSELKVNGGNTGEVEAGLKLIEIGLKNWALSAKRRAMEITQTLNTRSATSLKAEFQLDLIPVMISVAERLDEIENEAMFVLAQIEGLSIDDALLIDVWRETDFQMEQEASRIARIVSEFLDAIPGMPAALLEQLIMRWASSIDFLDLELMVDDGSGTKKPLKEVIAGQAATIAEADMEARIRQNELGVLGPAMQGAATGGRNNNPTAPRKTGAPGDPRNVPAAK